MELNQRHEDFQSSALPTELSGRYHRYATLIPKKAGPCQWIDLLQNRVKSSQNNGMKIEWPKPYTTLLQKPPHGV